MNPQKRPSLNVNDGPPDKIMCTQSSIAASMMEMKYKEMHKKWEERGTALTNKQLEINALNQKMSDMIADHEEEVKKYKTLLSFQNEEVNAEHFKDLHLSMSLHKDMSKKDLSTPRLSHHSRLPSASNASKPFTDVSNIDAQRPSEKGPNTKQKDLTTNLVIRNVYSKAGEQLESNTEPKYKIEVDKNLPLNLTRDEIHERFEAVCNSQERHSGQFSTFDKYNIINRQDILATEIFESDDRLDRLSIWTALNANEERFFYRDQNSSSPKLRQMHLISKDMQYSSAYSERKDAFDKINSSRHTVPQYFSRFYV